MAKYKNREVKIVRELPHPNGDQCEIEHVDLISLGKEIVPRKDVILTLAELKEITSLRTPESSNDFQVALVEKKPTGSLIKKDK